MNQIGANRNINAGFPFSIKSEWKHPPLRPFNMDSEPYAAVSLADIFAAWEFFV